MIALAETFATTLGLPAIAAFCRIGGCFLVLPGFSTGRVPANVRVLVVLGLVVALVPALGIGSLQVPDGFTLLSAGCFGNS